MSKRQLVSIFTTPSTPKQTPKPTPKPASKLKNILLQQLQDPQKSTPMPASKTKKPVPTLIKIDDEFEKGETTKSRPLSKNIWYEWYDWLMSHIPKSEKKV